MTEWLSEQVNKFLNVKGGSSMWTTLALLSTLSYAPAQAGQLELKNTRFTYGFLDTEPGDYPMTVEVKDVLGNKTAKPLEQKFTVKKLEFGIVRPGFVYLPLNEEQAGAPPLFAPPLAVPGQNLMLHFTTVGFTEAGEKNEPKVSVEVVIQDENGTPVLPKPIPGKAERYPDDNARKLKVLPFQVPIQVNRSGKFKIVIRAKDENNSGKTATFPPLDLTVVEVK